MGLASAGTVIHGAGIVRRGLAVLMLPVWRGYSPRGQTNPRWLNEFFRVECQKKKPVGNGPAGLLVENVMLEHLKLLLRIVVKIDVKVKIIIVRK